MSQIGSVGAHTLSLFGVKPDKDQMAALAAAAKAAEGAKAAEVKVAEAKAAPATGGMASSEEEPYGGDFYAYEAKAMEAARKFWAGEAKFAEENGFWRKAIHNVGSYNFAKAGRGGGANFGSAEEAMAMSNDLSSLTYSVKIINNLENKMTPDSFAMRVEQLGEHKARIMRAQILDEIESLKMEVFISATYIMKSVNVDNPDFLSIKNGEYTLKSTNFIFEGKLLMSLLDDGTIIKHYDKGAAYEEN